MPHFLVKSALQFLCNCFIKQNSSGKAKNLNDETPFDDTPFEFPRTNNYFEQYNASLKHVFKI